MKFGVSLSYSIAFFSIFILVHCSEEIPQPFVMSQDTPDNVTVIDINNDQSLGIEPIAMQKNYPDGIVALEKIKFKKNTTLNGNASVIGICEKEDDHEDDHSEESEETDDECKSEIKIDKDVVISGQSTLKADKIKIEKNAIVLGRLEANKFKIKPGAQAPDQNPLSTVPALPPFFQGTPGTVDVNGNSGVPLIEGSYHQLKLKKNESIELSGGYYHFKEIDAEKDNISIICKSTCIVMVQGGFEIGKRSKILSESGNPNKFYFYIESIKKDDDDDDDDHDDDHDEVEYEEVEIGKESNIVANFYFPYSEIEIKKNTTLNGILIGKEIEIDKNCTITSFGQTVPIGDRIISSTNIDVQSIEFLQSNGGIFSVTPPSNNVNLLTFVQDRKILQFTDFIELPANNYKAIRLVIGANNTANVDGVIQPIYIGNATPENTITFTGAFSLDTGVGKITKLTLATDADNTLIQPFGQVLFLRPVIEINQIEITKLPVGPFDVEGLTGSSQVLINFLPNGQFQMKSGIDRRLLISGDFNYNTYTEIMSFSPVTIACNGCGLNSNLGANSLIFPFKDFLVLSLLENVIEARQVGEADVGRFLRVGSFELPPDTEITVTVPVTFSNPTYNGHFLAAKLSSQNGSDRARVGFSQIFNNQATVTIKISLSKLPITGNELYLGDFVIIDDINTIEFDPILQVISSGLLDIDFKSYLIPISRSTAQVSTINFQGGF